MRKLVQAFPDWLSNLLMTAYRFPRAHFNDGLLSIHNSDFRRDPRFASALREALATGSYGRSKPIWRIYTSCWAASVASRLDGDFVECGVNLGGYARAVIDYVGFKDLQKTFWLLDTFNGLVEQQITAEERSRGLGAMGYSECYDEVCRTFAPFPSVRLVRGEVPGTLAQVTAERIAYLSIDMNCAAPEIAAIDHFWNKLVPGALVILDDYGWARHIGQKRAFDAFAREHGTEVFSLPTGQGLILKT